MRIVIDTNVFVSYFLTPNPHSTISMALDRAISYGTLILTQATFGELMAVIQREKFDRYTTPELRKQFIQDIIDTAEFAHITREIKACRDPDDDKFLDAAVHGNASVIITGDDDLLAMDGFMEVRIVTAGEFLALMKDE